MRWHLRRAARTLVVLITALVRGLKLDDHFKSRARQRNLFKNLRVDFIEHLRSAVSALLAQ